MLKINKELNFSLKYIFNLKTVFFVNGVVFLMNNKWWLFFSFVLKENNYAKGKMKMCSMRE